MTDILAFGAHPDDVELAMGGTLRKCVEEGYTVGLVDLTNGEPTPSGSPELRAKESAQASETLGAQFRITLDMPNRYLMDSVENRKIVAEVMRTHKPKLVFAPYWHDLHPDHTAASQIVDAARFYSKLTKTDMAGEPYFPPKIYYFMAVHLRYAFEPAFIVGLTKEQYQLKVDAVSCYKSQFNWTPGSVAFDRVTAGNAYFGSLVQHPYGEPFMMKEEIVVSKIADLL